MLPPDPPIICNHCHKDTGYTNRGLTHFLIPSDGLQCQSCGKTFLEKTGRTWVDATWCSTIGTIEKIQDRLSDDIVEWDGHPGLPVDQKK